MLDPRITPADGPGRLITPLRLPELRPAGESFGSALGRALASVESSERQAEQAATALATGQSPDTAQSVATIEKANISLQFAISIRNKLLEAYQEVMRMPV